MQAERVVGAHANTRNMLNHVDIYIYLYYYSIYVYMF